MNPHSKRGKPVSDFDFSSIRKKRLDFGKLMPTPLTSFRRSDAQILQDYEKTGYLGVAVGTVKSIYPVTERRCFLLFEWRSFLGSFVPATIGIGYVIWSFINLGLGAACFTFLPAIIVYALIRSWCDVDEFFLTIDVNERARCIEVSSYGPWADVLTLERVIVVDSKGKTQQIDRVPPVKFSYHPLKIGDKVSRYDDRIIFPLEAKNAARVLAEKIRNEANRAAAQAKADAQKREAEAAELAKKQAIQRAELDESFRLMHCRLDDWRTEPTEPFIRHLPLPWMPFATVGLAYANVVPYGSLPPIQRFDGHHQRWETVGQQSASTRGIYLIGTNSQRTFNRQALVVGPTTLPGTNSQDLVMFVLDYNGAVKFLGNPARWEIYDVTQTDEEKKKLAMLRPVLTKLYERVLSAGPGSSGWA